MVDELKNQMHRFENLIGFEGKLETVVASRMSMEELINALSSKYKKDVHSSLRLHRLEFFYDLVESRRRKRERQEAENFSKQRAKQKSSRTKEKEEKSGTADEEQQLLKTEVKEVRPKISDEVVKIEAKDIDDWKDLMTLSRIYYVMEHPRSEGLTWKRRITKKKTIDKFEAMDLIEWKVSQKFRLRGLEEWAQRRSDAHQLAEKSDHDFEDIDEIDEDSKELDDLFEMFDPSGRTKRKKSSDLKQKKPPPDRPFKLSDESIEDWTESYSEDSDYSDVGDFAEEVDDFMDEKEKTFDFEEPKSPTESEEEDISELFAVYPEFSAHREPIFREMDEAKTFEDWFKLYKKAISQIEELKTKEQVIKFEEKLDMITEEEGEERDEEPLGKEKFDEKPLEEEKYAEPSAKKEEKHDEEPLEEEKYDEEPPEEKEEKHDKEPLKEEKYEAVPSEEKEEKYEKKPLEKGEEEKVDEQSLEEEQEGKKYDGESSEKEKYDEESLEKENGEEEKLVAEQTSEREIKIDVEKGRKQDTGVLDTAYIFEKETPATESTREESEEEFSETQEANSRSGDLLEMTKKGKKEENETAMTFGIETDKTQETELEESTSSQIQKTNENSIQNGERKEVSISSEEEDDSTVETGE